VSAFSVPLGGYLADVTKKPNLFIVGGAIGAAVTCFAIPYLAPALVWIVLFGLLRGGCTGGIMALPAEVLNQRSRHTGFAIAPTVYFVSMTTVPIFAGHILEVTGNVTILLWFAGTLWLTIVVVLGVFRLLQSRWTSP
jgi:MFS family permease